MHLESSFRIQRDPANVANVLRRVVDVLVRLQPRKVLELFRALE